MFVVNIEECVCVYASMCACTNEKSYTNRHFMFSVFPKAQLQATQVISTGGIIYDKIT